MCFHRYVSAMVPVKSVKEHDAQLDVAVLFSEVLDRALKYQLITQDQIDYCDPMVMIAIPRLSIVWLVCLFFPYNHTRLGAYYTSQRGL